MGRRSAIDKVGLLEYLKEACAQNGGTIRASLKELSEWVGSSTPTLTKYLDSLVSEGSVTIRRGRPASYTVHDAPLQHMAGIEAGDADSGQRLTRLLSELVPVVDELTVKTRMTQELARLREFVDSLEVVYKDEMLTLYKRRNGRTESIETATA